MLVSDASQSHVSGVLTTVNETVCELRRRGHDVVLISPENVGTAVNFPLYPDVRWVLNPWKVWKVLRESRMTAIHIVTEGPLGLFAARFCVSLGIQYTTSYHTKIPEYINEQVRMIPVRVGYEYMRLTHACSQTVLVNTESLRDDLLARRFHANIHLWGRAVDTRLFQPMIVDTANASVETDRLSHVHSDIHKIRVDFPGARILLYVGRMTRQKNVEAFLDVSVPRDCVKVLIGSGPDSIQYEAYAKCRQDTARILFLGPKPYEDLPYYYSIADAFVFPSKTDTLGLVMLEAMSCGAPVAAFRVTGPVDVIRPGVNGVMCEDESGFQDCIEQCLNLRDRQSVRESALCYSWERETDVFEGNLKIITDTQQQAIRNSPFSLLLRTQVESMCSTVSLVATRTRGPRTHVQSIKYALSRPVRYISSKKEILRSLLAQRSQHLLK